MKAADELMIDATSKLHDAISATAVNKQTVNAWVHTNVVLRSTMYTNGETEN